MWVILDNTLYCFRTMYSFTKCLLFIYILQLSHANSVNQYKSYKNYKIYEIEGLTEDVFNLLDFVAKYDIPYDVKRLPQKSIRSDVPSLSKSLTQILIAPELASLLEEQIDETKLKKEIVSHDFSELLEFETRSPLGSKSFSWTDYYDVDDIYGYLTNTSKEFSNWTELIQGGETYEGRTILGLRINTPNNYNGKPVIFIESGIHAREWITPATTTYFINELLTTEDPKVAAMRDMFDWRIFPVINPDGYHYSFTDRGWRKTRSLSSNGCYGADANRNWDYNWMNHGASSNPCNYQIYGGTKPFSEVETRTLSEYISQIENLQAYIAFHSYAQTLLLPYSDSTDHVDNYDDLVQIGKVSLDYGEAVNGVRYTGPGTAAEILYKASGGSMDWVRNKLGTPLVYTYELRGYFFSWPPHRIHEQGDEVTQMMLGLVTEAINLGYF